jgi:hypothetical protein
MRTPCRSEPEELFRGVGVRRMSDLLDLEQGVGVRRRQAQAIAGPNDEHVVFVSVSGLRVDKEDGDPPRPVPSLLLHHPGATIPVGRRVVQLNRANRQAGLRSSGVRVTRSGMTRHPFGERGESDIGSTDVGHLGSHSAGVGPLRMAIEGPKGVKAECRSRRPAGALCEGSGCSIIPQRSARVHKDVPAQVDTSLASRAALT